MCDNLGVDAHKNRRTRETRTVEPREGNAPGVNPDPSRTLPGMKAMRVLGAATRAAHEACGIISPEQWDRGDLPEDWLVCMELEQFAHDCLSRALSSDQALRDGTE